MNTVSLKKSIRNKAGIVFLITALMSVTLSSCESDDDYYSLGDIWLSLGIIDKPESGSLFTVLLDNGDTLVPVSSAVPNFMAKDQQRIMVNYTILDEVGQAENKFYVKINNLHDVLYKNIIEETETNSDSIGDDPVQIDDIWKSGHFLNIEFSFLGGGKTHYINLVRPAGNIDELPHPVELELRHNAFNDRMGYVVKSIVTFDLQSLKTDEQDSVSFSVRSVDYEGNEHSFNGIYY